MARSRDISKVLSSNSTLATDAEVAATYQTKAGTGLVKIVPSSVVVVSGTGSADSLGTVTFSGASSVSLNNVFSANYTRYRILVNATWTGNEGAYFRLRTSGTDATGSNYGVQNIRGASTTLYGTRAALTNWDLNYTASAGNELFEIELFNPFAASQTYGFSRYTAKLLASTTELWLSESGITHSLSTSYDGITFYSAANTMIGTASVYGYN
jgi:hypothetical protein